ncbi:13068_t:CDS:2, partial [Cetraspora pellucida]
MLNYLIDEISKQKGDVVAGLLGGFFGNIVEMIISVFALIHGEIDIVKTSLLGSIISNLLLVLGTSMFIGGCYYKEQEFNGFCVETLSNLMILSSISLIIPASFHIFLKNNNRNDLYSRESELYFSYGTSICLIIIYLLFLHFQMNTHLYLFNNEEDEEDENLLLPLNFCYVMLFLITIAVGVSSENLVGSIESVSVNYNISKSFIGIIILPLVGNVPEHFTGVIAAIRNKMDLTIFNTIGSSMQISLFVIPVLVMVGWIIGQPMNFSFGGFETVVLFVSVLISNYIIRDGKSNWLEGAIKKNEREKIYKENENKCGLCNTRHFRCKLKKCTKCCNINKCDSYPCKYCEDNGIECEYSIIKTKEKFNELEKLGLSAYVAQLEYTSNHKLHVQAYCQFNKRKTKKDVKNMFKNQSIALPEHMMGDTQSNIYYAKKKHNKCESHKKNGCKCHYKEDKNYICEVCTSKCPERTISRIEDLPSSVGPFEFGNFRNLVRKRNEFLIEDMIRIKRIRDEGITYEEIILNPEKYAPLTWLQAPSGYEKMQKDKKALKKRLKGGRFWRPVVFYLYGPGGSGKSGLRNNNDDNDDCSDYENLNKRRRIEDSNILIIEEIGESSNTMNNVIEEINDSRNDELVDDIVEFLIETDDDDNENHIIVDD